MPKEDAETSSAGSSERKYKMNKRFFFRVLSLFDNNGLRSVLISIINFYLKITGYSDRKIIFDEYWIHKYKESYAVISPKLYIKKPKNFSKIFEDIEKECREFWYFNYSPKKGDVIVDIGTGIGTDIIIFSRDAGDSGSVIAVEAQPKMFKILNKQIEYNGLKNVKTYNIAVSDKKGPVFISDLDDYELNSINFYQNEKESIKVNATDLDSFFKEIRIDKVDFLKMKIEGAEKYAVAGMKEIIRNTKKICIACHDFLGTEEKRTKAQVMEFLEWNNFSITVNESSGIDAVRYHLHGTNNNF